MLVSADKNAMAAANAQPQDFQGRKIDLLHRISEALGYDMGLSEALQVIVNVTADLMESKIVSILLYDETQRQLSLAATQSLSRAYRDKPPVAVDHSVSGRAVFSMQAQAIPDVQADENYGYKAVAQAEGIVSLLCVPMVVKGKAIGTINSYSATRRDYTPEDIKLLSLVASQAAVAVENARLQAATSAIQQDLEARKIITQAKMLLMKTKRLDEPAAHRFLQKESMNRRKPMRDIAEALLIAERAIEAKDRR